MAGAILAGAAEGFLEGLGWLVRRGSSFFVSLMFGLKKVPPQMWSSLSDHRNGVGFYADPLGKPSLLTHWRGLVEFSYASVSLAPKQTAEEGLAAAAGGGGGSSASGPSDWDGDGVTVADNGGYLEFLPPSATPPTANETAATGVGTGQPLVGVIIFPGALILPTAYAPLARTMARRGYPSYVLRFGLNLATNGWETAGEIISPQQAGVVDGDACAAGATTTAEQGEETESCQVVASSTSPCKWVLVGHSMGAVGIELFYPENSARVHGVVYMGAGNMIGDALAGADVPAMVLRGSRDPFVPPEALARSAHKLPEGFETVVLEGGSHRGFASYTRQPLDWQATITEQEQRRLVVEALVDFIGRKVVAY